MEKIINIFKGFEINNMWQVFPIAVVLVIAMSLSVQLFLASKMETLLMEKSDLSKRLSMTLLIMFIVLAYVNCLFSYEASTFLILFAALFIVTIAWLICFELEKRKKKPGYKKYSEDIYMFLIILAGPVFAKIYASLFSVNEMSCAIIVAFIEVFLFIMLYPQIIKKRQI